MTAKSFREGEIKKNNAVALIFYLTYLAK